MSTHTNKRLAAYSIWVVSILFFLYEFFLRTFVGSLSTELSKAFTLSPVMYAWIGVAYVIPYGIMQIPAVSLSERWGIKKTLLLSCLSCALATFYFAVAQTGLDALLAHALMGAASSFAFVVLVVVLCRYFPRRHFAWMMGVSQCLGTLGPVLAAGPLLAWIMAYCQHHWRVAMTQVAEVGLVLACLIICCIPKTTQIQIETSETTENPSAPTGTTQSPMILKLQKLWNWRICSLILAASALYAPLFLIGAVWGQVFFEAKALPALASAYLVSIAWVGYALGCLLVGCLPKQVVLNANRLEYFALLGMLASSLLVFATGLHDELVLAVLMFAVGLAASGLNIAYAMLANALPANLNTTAIALLNASVTGFNTLLPLWVGSKIANAQGHCQMGLLCLPALYLVAWLLLKSEQGFQRWPVLG